MAKTNTKPKKQKPLTKHELNKRINQYSKDFAKNLEEKLEIEKEKIRETNLKELNEFLIKQKTEDIIELSDTMTYMLAIILHELGLKPDKMQKGMDLYFAHIDLFKKKKITLKEYEWLLKVYNISILDTSTNEFKKTIEAELREAIKKQEELKNGKI